MHTGEDLTCVLQSGCAVDFAVDVPENSTRVFKEEIGGKVRRYLLGRICNRTTDGRQTKEDGIATLPDRSIDVWNLGKVKNSSEARLRLFVDV